MAQRARPHLTSSDLGVVTDALSPPQDYILFQALRAKKRTELLSYSFLGDRESDINNGVTHGDDARPQGRWAHGYTSRSVWCL